MTVFTSSLPPLDVDATSTLTEFVMNKAAKHGDKVAMHEQNSGASLTFNQLRTKINKAVVGLAAKGVSKGDVVCIYSPNDIEYPIAFHAVATLGGTLTTANPLYTANELLHQLKDSKAVFVITVAAFLEKAKEAVSQLPDGTVRDIFVFGAASPDHEDVKTFSSLLEIEGEAPKVDFDPKTHVVAIPYSSGTTGLPKGVMLTHTNIISNLQQLDIVEADVATSGPHCYIGVLPFYHIYAMTVVLNLGVMQGVKSVIVPRFDFKQFLEIVQEHKVTYMHIVPPIVLALAKHPLVASFDLSSLKVIFCGAAPLSGELEDEVRARLPDIVVKQAYGMTEAAPAIFVTPTAKAKKGSGGMLISGMEAKVLDTETGKELGVNEDGEIVCRGPNVMKGYLNREDATAATVISGWLHTGDVGHVDEEGYWFIVDRVKELIKYKGFQVPPAELEALLLTHSEIADSAVVGRPDDEAGELPKAFVVLKPGSELTSEAIAAWVAERVAPHKKLRGGVKITDKIPKSSSGKILRRLLRDAERKEVADAKAAAKAGQ